MTSPNDSASSGEPTAADFNKGDPVRYVPRHAHGDTGHPDCENGIVSSCNERFVFVRYYAKVGGIESSGLRFHAQATDPIDLIKT